MNKATLKKLMKDHDYEHDNYGQIVFYSGWFEHGDGSLSTEPEENEDEEDEEE